MPTITVETYIIAHVDLCFDLARDIGVHCRTAEFTQERAIAGVTTGMIGLGQEVTFEAVHFGIRQQLTARVTEFKRPYRFVDEMLRGSFKSMRHVHEFTADGPGTLMKDELTWISPFGPIGSAADKLFLEAHMRRFLMRRNSNLKRIAEELAE